MPEYVVTLGGMEYHVTVNADGTIHVPGQEGGIEVRPINAMASSVLIGKESILVTASYNTHKAQVLLGGNCLEASVETARDRLLRKYSVGVPSASRRTELRAPMPALVVRVNVKPGDEVREGEALLVLEAMKMENELRCHHTGRVKEVLANEGRSVEKGELLILLE